MRERPILFSGPMVRAVIKGWKTHTRRVIKPQFNYAFGWGIRNDDDTFSVNVDIKTKNNSWRWLRCPYGKPGDLLWVRETFAKRYADAERDPADGIMYRADGGCIVQPRWTPSIYMPRWASRLTLRITDVRVQRVQEITPKDAQAEGVGHGSPDDSDNYDVMQFASLWDSINAKRGYSWESNPWVWAISFERVSA